MPRPIIIMPAPARREDQVRIARLAGVGLTLHAYHETFQEVLLPSDSNDARLEAKWISNELSSWPNPAVVVLLGRRAERAFGWAGLKYFDVHENCWGKHSVLMLPHPSKDNLWWTNPKNVETARSTMRWVLRVSS